MLYCTQAINLAILSNTYFNAISVGFTMKFSVILGNLGNTKDRFLSLGYKASPSLEDMFKQAASIKDVKGVELVGS